MPWGGGEETCCAPTAENVMESLRAGDRCHPFAPNKPHPTAQLWRGHASHSWIARLQGSEPRAAWSPWWPCGGGEVATRSSLGTAAPAWDSECCFGGVKGKLLFFGLADCSVSCSAQLCRRTPGVHAAAICLKWPFAPVPHTWLLFAWGSHLLAEPHVWWPFT